MSARGLVIIAGISLLLTCCVATPPTEEKLVGTWGSRAYGDTLKEANQKPKPGEAFSQFVYKSDHTYVASRTDDPKTVTGTWRIEGDYLVQRVNGSSKEERTFILQLTNSKLVFISIFGTEGHWWRMGTF